MHTEFAFMVVYIWCVLGGLAILAHLILEIPAALKFFARLFGLNKDLTSAPPPMRSERKNYRL